MKYAVLETNHTTSRVIGVIGCSQVIRVWPSSSKSLRPSLATNISPAPIKAWSCMVNMLSCSIVEKGRLDGGVNPTPAEPNACDQPNIWVPRCGWMLRTDLCG